MSDVHSVFEGGLNMLDGALCHFMGEGITLISQETLEGKVEQATVHQEAYRHMLQTWDAGQGADWINGATVDNVAYHWMDERLVLITDKDAEAVVVLSLDDVRAALGVLVH